jgi:hypothetical protein
MVVLAMDRLELKGRVIKRGMEGEMAWGWLISA